MEGLVEADFDSGEEVVAAADGDTFCRESWIRACKERDDFVRRHRGLCSESGKRWRNGDGVVGRARVAEEVVRTKAGAGAMRAPFVLEQTLIRIDVAEG